LLLFADTNGDSPWDVINVPGIKNYNFTVKRVKDESARGD